MRKRRSRILWVITRLGIFMCLVVLAGVGLATYRLRQLEGMQALNAPPGVMIVSPEDELVVAPGYLLGVGATATGPNRIERIELWMDGVKVDEVINSGPAELSPFSADFVLNIPEGQHVLVTRAVDSASLVGQSLPKGIFADPQLADQEIFGVYTLQESQTLEGVAQAFSVDPKSLKDLNPGLGDGELPPGTSVTIPEPKGKENDKPVVQENPPPVPIIVPPNMAPLDTAEVNSNFAGLNLFASDTSATQPPKAPTNLQVQADQCKMILTWQDNADNELAYGVWVKEIVGPGRRIASLRSSASTGPAWFQFDALPIGFYGIQVEAVNWLGRQPSNLVWIRVDELGCATRTATELEFEVTKFDVTGSYQGVYCYLSAEGGPHIRIPPEANSYYPHPSQTGFGWGAGGNGIIAKYIFRIPDDGVLDLEGDCFGVDPSNSPNPKIGHFNVQLPESTWDGHERSITIGSDLWFTLRLLGLTIAEGPFSYIDGTLTRPKIIEARVVSPGVPIFDRERILTWSWDVKAARGKGTLTGFTIFLNGIAIQQVGPEVREERLWLPASCGRLVTYEVAANFGGSQSEKDKWLEVLPDCPVEVRVEFDQIHLDRGDSCDEEAMLVEIYLKARFNETLVERNSINGFLYPAINCGTWNIENLLPAGKYPVPSNVMTSQLGEGKSGMGWLEITAWIHHVDSGWVGYVHTVRAYAPSDWTVDGIEDFNLPFSGEFGTGWISVRLSATSIKP